MGLLQLSADWDERDTRPMGQLTQQGSAEPYDLCIRQRVCRRMTWITLTRRSCIPTSDSAGMLLGIIWTFAQGTVLLRTYACAHTGTGLLGLQVAMLGHFLTCHFLCAECSAYCASKWAATSCPGTLDAGSMCQH